MTKNTSFDKKQNSGDLKRRPIHTETQPLNENQKKKLDNDSNNSPLVYKKLYPDLKDEDEQFIQEEDDECNDDVTPCATSTSSIYDYLLRIKYVVFLLIVLVLYYFTSLNTQTFPKDLTLQGKLNNMKDQFHDQNHETFRILEKALKKVVNVTEDPSAPAIFTFSVNKNAIHKSHIFSHHLADILAPQNTLLINESISWHNNPKGIKLKIDQDIRSKAEKRNLFVVVVDNLQNLPLESAMIFHGFCDHETAPFKKAVFIFIVPLNEILPNGTSLKKIDKAAFQQLKNIWRNASPDEIDSLITRITVNVINII